MFIEQRSNFAEHMPDYSIKLNAIILLFALVQALLMGGIVGARAVREGNWSDGVLTLLLGLLGLSTVPHLFGWLGIGVLWNDYTFLPWNGLELAILPTAYLLLWSRLDHEWRPRWAYLKHYWLYLLYFFYHLVVGLQGKEFAQWWWFEVNNRYNLDAVFSLCNTFLFVVYLRRFFRTYRAFQVWSADRYANLPPLSIHWLRNFLLASALLAGIDVGLTAMELTIGAQYDKMAWAYLGTLGLVCYIGFYGLLHPPVVHLDFKAKSSSDATAPVPPLFSEAEILAWQQRLRIYFDEKQPYLNPDLRLAGIAQELGINVSTLSILVNRCFGQNFNDLINGYRIELLKQKVAQGDLQRFTLLSLAYDVGFNSKTTFNRAFKKYEGMAPSDFFEY